MNKLNSSKLHNNGFLRELSYNGIGGAGPAPSKEPIKIYELNDNDTSGSYDDTITIERDGILIGVLSTYGNEIHITNNGETIESDAVVPIKEYRYYMGFLVSQYPVHAGDQIRMWGNWSSGGATAILLYLI